MNVGVIGYGYWGPNLVRNFTEMQDSQVLHISDLDSARLARASSRYPGVKVSTDYREMLRDTRLDAVAIATPVSTHFDLAKEILESGRHVLIEKPMTDSVASAAELLEIAQRKKLVLTVDHTFLYTGAVQKIRELMDNEELGEIYYFDSVRINLGLLQQDINVVWDLGAHDLAIMFHLLGMRPKAISAVGEWHFREGVEDIAYLTALFENRCIAHFHLSWLAPVKVRMTLIGGSRKMVVYDDTQTSEKVKVYDKGVSVDSREDIYEALWQYRVGDMHAPKLDQTEALRVECTHFLDCIESGKTPLTDGAFGLEIVRVLEAAEQSIRNDGKLISIA